MASKGPKTGTAKPAAPKPAVQAKKPVAPKAKIVAPAVEKPAPEPVAETIVPAVVAEPVPAVEAAPQELIETVEAVAEPVVEAVTETATNAAAVVETVVAPVKETVKMATNFENNTVENNTAKAQAFFADFNDRTKAAVEKSTKLVEEANDFAKGNVEALVESGRIAAKGFETFGQDAAEYSRKSFESATAALKTMASVKSPTEFFKLQSDFVRGAFDSYVAEASKNTEALLKLAGDAAQPLSNRVAVAAEKAKTAA
jgi:phasin family protein